MFSKMRDIARMLVKYFRAQPWLAAAVGIFSLFYGSMCVLIPYVEGQFINVLVQKPGLKAILVFCAVYAIATLFNIVSMYLTKMSGTKFSLTFSQMFKKDTLQYIQNCSLKDTSSKSTEEFAFKVNNDCELLMIFSLNTIQSSLNKIIMLLVPLVFLAFTDWIICLVVLLSLPLIFFLSQFFLDKLYKANLAATNARTNFFVAMTDQIKNLRFIKLNSLQEILGKRYDLAAKDSFKANLSQTRVEFGYSLFSTHASLFLQLFLFIYGGFAIIEGRMQIGTYVVIATYLQLVVSGFTYFMEFKSQLAQYYAYYTRIKAIQDMQLEQNGRLALAAVDSVSCAELGFAYSEGEPIFQGRNFNFERGKIYTIVGANGAGKSTLISLLTGLYRGHYEGQICYSGTDICELDLIALRKDKFAISEQEPVLLQDSIAFNITYQAKEDRDQPKMAAALEAVSLQQFIAQLPEGLESKIEEGASNLSGGQKQKISLAKALYKEADVLILDEPTSALDANSLEIFIERLSALREQKIVIIITHDKRFLSIADEVIELERLNAAACP